MLLVVALVGGKPARAELRAHPVEPLAVASQYQALEAVELSHRPVVWLEPTTGQLRRALPKDMPPQVPKEATQALCNSTMHGQMDHGWLCDCPPLEIGTYRCGRILNTPPPPIPCDLAARAAGRLNGWGCAIGRGKKEGHWRPETWK